MSWQVNNGPLEPVPPEMYSLLQQAYGPQEPNAARATEAAQSALRSNRSGSGSSDAAVHSAGSSGNDSPPTVRGTPPAAQELTQQQMMQLLQQQQEQMQQMQQQNQMLMQQMAAQSGSKPLPRPPATSSSSSSNPRLDAALAKASQARAAAQEQQARLAPLLASTPASAAASTSTPGAPATSTPPAASAPQSSAPIPPGECFTYKGKDYHIPGMIGHSGTSVTFMLADGRNKETVDIATMCTQPITFREGFHPSFKIHMLLENKMVPFDTMKVLLHPDFVPDHMLNLYNGQNTSILHRAAAGGIKKVRTEVVSSRVSGTAIQREIVEESIVGYLIKRGADVNIPLRRSEKKDNYYMPCTPLFSAAHEGNYYECELLLKSGAVPRGSVTVKGAWTCPSALHKAAEYGYKDIVKLLLEWGCDIDAVDGEGRTPLTLACKGCKEDVVEMLVFGFIPEMKEVDNKKESQKPIQANVTRMNDGTYPLVKLATSRFNSKILKKAIERGADPKAKFPGLKGNPSIGAVAIAAICQPPSQGTFENLDVLLKAMMDSSGKVPHSELTYKRRKEGRTPLENARETGDTGLIQTLKKYGDDDSLLKRGIKKLI